MTITEEYHKDLTIITISEIGSNHRALLIPNQDAVAHVIDKGNYVLTVSDGVGSCRKAQDGSKYAVSACVNVFEKLLEKKIEFEGQAIIEAVISEWRSLIDQVHENDYCSTLKAIFKIGNVMIVVSIGDGFIAITSDGIALLTPTVTCDFSNETSCLSSHITASDFWTADFHLDTYKPYAVFCCTDGIANGLIPGNEINLSADIEAKIRSDELKDTLVELINEIARYSFDDKTVGVIKYGQQS